MPIIAMAGLTSTFPFKSQLSLSSRSSKLFGKRPCKITILGPSLKPYSGVGISVSARFGGGGGRGGSASRSGGKRSPRQKNSSGSDSDDGALDISSIRSTTVRLIDEKQNMVGVVSKSEALQMADAAELDLVILSPDAEPPVVRIMDYSKFRYEQQKKKRDQQKKSLAGRMDLKELKMGYNISVHDYSVRLRAAQKFLKDGDKVKVIVNLKGRENEFRNNAIELIRRFQEDVGELAVEESKNFSDRNMNIVLVPNKLVTQKAQEVPKNEISAAV